MLGGEDGHCWRGVVDAQTGTVNKDELGVDETVKSWSPLVPAFKSPCECEFARNQDHLAPLGRNDMETRWMSQMFMCHCMFRCNNQTNNKVVLRFECVVRHRERWMTRRCCVCVRMMKEELSVWWSDREFGRSTTGRSLTLTMALYSVRCRAFFSSPFPLQEDGRMDGVSQHTPHTHTHTRTLLTEGGRNS